VPSIKASNKTAVSLTAELTCKGADAVMFFVPNSWLTEWSMASLASQIKKQVDAYLTIDLRDNPFTQEMPQNIDVFDACDVTPLNLHKPKPIIANEDDDKTLRQKSFDKLVEFLHGRESDSPDEEIYIDRFNHELAIISARGLSEKYLKTFSLKDIERFAKTKRLLARGSWGNSLLMYLHGLSIVDPVKLDLPFELNAYRKSVAKASVDRFEFDICPVELGYLERQLEDVHCFEYFKVTMLHKVKVAKH